MWQRCRPPPFIVCPGPDLPWEVLLKRVADPGPPWAPGFLGDALIAHVADHLSTNISTAYLIWSSATEGPYASRA
eukprot:8983049-Pyramimonas_sp.AAC.1